MCFLSVYLFNEKQKKLIKNIYLAGGCFWCTEAVFKRIKGVSNVISGYTGGTIKNPAYREVCSGRTGHAEAISLCYDTIQISLTELLTIFFTTHDPTTLNRQGNDCGTQYRSGIYYTSDDQKEMIVQLINQLSAMKIYDQAIVTEVKAATTFYPAEIEHQDFYDQNSNHPYCQAFISPKLEKLKHLFKHNLV